MPGPNQFQVRRTSVADREANTLTLPNAGELALNILDGRLFSTNGAVVFEVGANTKNCRVSNSFFVGSATVNVFANSTIIQVSNSTVNTHLAVPTSGQYSATNYFLHANGSWVQVTGGGGSTRVYQSYTATGGQTTYTVSGGYTVGQIEVFENGVHLANTEYTQDGSTVVLTTGSLAGAIIEVSGWIALSSFTPVASGSNTWVQFNDSSAFGSTDGFTFDKATNTAVIANTLTVGSVTINSTGGFHSGTVNATAFTVGTAWTANSTLVNANALNCRNQVNTVTFFATTTANVGTTQMTTSDVSVGGVSIVPFGLQTIFVPAYAMYAANTNGAAAGQIETANAVVIKTFDFDTTTPEFVQFAIQMPTSWNEGTLTAQFLWSHGATGTPFGVAWSIEATSFSDGAALNTAFTGTVTTTDTGGTQDDIYISAESAAVTVAATPIADDYVIFRVTRATGNAGDTYADDARLHGVKIHYTTDTAHD